MNPINPDRIARTISNISLMAMPKYTKLLSLIAFKESEGIIEMLFFGVNRALSATGIYSGRA